MLCHRLIKTCAALASGTILNVALAAIDGEHNGHKPVGIRYFANMHKHKQLPSRVATCCENHGTHLLGALPQVTAQAPCRQPSGLCSCRSDLG